MSTRELWEQFQRGGLQACDPRQASTAGERHYLSVLAASEHAWRPAAEWACDAARLQPDSLLLREAADYLERRAGGQRDVPYAAGDTADGPAAFDAFVNGGGNVPLYQAVSSALTAAHRRQADALGHPIRLLDIGVGNGRALLPALSDAVGEIHVIEPSDGMLREFVAALTTRGLTPTVQAATAQDALANTRDRWDVVEATFSLHSIPPKDRIETLARLRGRCKKLLVVEFDVREFEHDLAPERVLAFQEGFERGLAEYAPGERDLIARGFLMPVYFGYFDPGAERVTHEHGLRTWVGQLQRAGFEHVRCHLLYRYWWAPTYLIEAS